jgi:hypothetical protein
MARFRFVVLLPLLLTGVSCIFFAPPAPAGFPESASPHRTLISPDILPLQAIPLDPDPNIELVLQLGGNHFTMEALAAIVVPEGPLPTMEIHSVEMAPILSGELIQANAVATTEPLQAHPQIEELGFIRQSRLARLRIPRRMANLNDFRAVKMTLKLIWPEDHPIRRAPQQRLRPAENRGPHRRNLERLVLNPQQIDGFAIPYPTLTEDRQPHPWTPQNFSWALRIETTSAGLHQISGQELINFRPALAAEPRQHLRLVTSGQSIPFTWLDSPDQSGDTLLKSNDTLLFYARETTSPYSLKTVHWLVSDPSMAYTSLTEVPALLPDSDTPTVLTTTWENHFSGQDLQLKTRTDQFLTILDYRWIWKELKPGQPTEVVLEAPRLDPEAAGSTPLAGTIRLFMTQFPTGPQPITLQLAIPGEPLQTRTIQGINDDTHPFLISPANLKPDGVPVSLTIVREGMEEAPMDVFLDSLTIQYPRRLQADGSTLQFGNRLIAQATTETQNLAFQIEGTVGDNPLLAIDDLAEPRFLRPLTTENGLSFSARIHGLADLRLSSLQELPRPQITVWEKGPDLRAPGQAGSLVLISHPTLTAAMNPLVQQWTREGQAVISTTIQQVYDQFTAGEETPYAIRIFLAHQARYGIGSPTHPAASYLVLVGDCTSAFRNQFRNEVPNQVPSYPYHSAFNEKERFASDSWYGRISGEDEFLDVIVSRFSLTREQEIRNAVEKTLEDRQPSPGAWLNTVGMVADHTEFEAASHRLTRLLPKNRFLQRIHLGEQPWTDNFYFPKEIADAKKAKVSPAATSRIRDMFQSGARLITYIGHGSPNIWSTERMWFGGGSENSDILSLHHPGRYPILVNMTCNSGAIDYPLPRWNVAISEDFLRHRYGGAVALYVPSGPGTTPQHEHLSRELFRAMFDDETLTFGASTALAASRYLVSNPSPDLIRMFVLLGDPLVPLYLTASLPNTTDSDGASSLSRQRRRVGEVDSMSLTDITPETEALPDLPPPGLQELQAPTIIASYDAHTGKREWSTELPDHFALQMRPLIVNGPILQDSTDDLSLSVVLHNPHSVPLPVGPSTTPFVVIRDAHGQIQRTLALPKSQQTIAPGESLQFNLPTGPLLPGIYLASPSSKDGIPLPTMDRADMPGAIFAVKPPVSALPDPALFVMALDSTADLQPSGSQFQAMVRVALLNAGQTPSETIQLGLQCSDSGLLLNESVTSVSGLLPGQSQNLALMGEALITSSALQLWSNSSDLADPKVLDRKIISGREALADLVIDPAKITVIPPSPTDGETVFFDIPIENRSARTAYQITLEGTNITDPLRPEPILARPQRIFPRLPLMAPHSSSTLRLRWDPFANSGECTVRITAKVGSTNADANPDNNTAEVSFRVRTKWRLRRGQVGVIPPTQEDIQARQLRFAARLHNDGETDAHSVRVTFYATPERTPASRLGEVLVDRISANNHADAVLIYNMKPGDETRSFSPTAEAVLRGSAQRLLQSGP